MKKRTVIWVLGLLVLIYMISTAIGFISTEPGKKPVIKDKLQSNDYNYLYDFYFSSNPTIAGRTYFGNPNASITIISYIDISSDVSRQFMRETFPFLKTGYIDTGTVKYYPKSYLTKEDYQQKNERFKYAMYLFCIIEQKKDYYDIYLELFNVSEPYEVIGLAESHNLSIDELLSCMGQEDASQVIVDLSEVENSGMSMNPRFYIGTFGKDNTIIEGIPTERRFTRTIKDYQILLGD